MPDEPILRPSPTSRSDNNSFVGKSEPVAPLAREAFIMLMACSAFLIFFQTYLFAPLLPSLAVELHASLAAVGWIIPAFMIPYGISALFYGTLADRHGRQRVLHILLTAVVATTLLSAWAHDARQLIFFRLLAGVSSGGVIPIAIAMMGDLYPYRERGRPLGWLFSGMAGGAAFGSTLGAYLNPTLGWRRELIVVGLLSGVVVVLIRRYGMMKVDHERSRVSLLRAFVVYGELLRSPRGSRAYTFIFFNSAFHSGVFSWLGLYFVNRYHLDDRGVGIALLCYGIPGMILGPVIGRQVDRWGRNRILPLGLAVGAVSAFLLVPSAPIIVSALVAGLLSLGYDLTQPLLAGLVTSLDAKRRAQTICLSAFFLFVGFGSGPLLFQAFAQGDLSESLLIFAVMELALALIGLRLFRSESVAAAAGHV